MKRLKPSHSRSNPISRLLERQLTGQGQMSIFKQTPSWMIIPYHPSICRSPILLGFSSMGSWLWGLSALEDEDKVRIEATILDHKSGRAWFDLVLPNICYDPVDDITFPLTMIDVAEKAVFVVVNQDTFGHVINHFSLFIIDETSGLRSTLVYTTSDTEDGVEPSIHHVYAFDGEYACALELVCQLRIIQVSEKALPMMTSTWWRKEPIAAQVQANQAKVQPHVTCLTLDVEGKDCRTVSMNRLTRNTGFLKLHLQRLLELKLVVAQDTLDEMSFRLLDYSLQFVRFLTVESFEFIAVARVRTLKTEHDVAIVALITRTGLRIIKSLESTGAGTASSKTRCRTLIQARQRGYDDGRAVLMNNEPLLLGRPLERLVNQAYPFEIVEDLTAE